MIISTAFKCVHAISKRLESLYLYTSQRVWLTSKKYNLVAVYDIHRMDGGGDLAWGVEDYSRKVI